MSALTFAREFVRNWKETGAVMPSSRALAHSMCQAANVPLAKRVLELGPGTGAITTVIHEALPPVAHYLGIELNSVFVHNLKRRFTGFHFEQACAQEFDFDRYLPAGERFDAIVSGLPWTAFPESLQIGILHNVLPRLAPGGGFVTFAYWGFHKLSQGRHFRELLQRQEGTFSISPVVWGNLPPAFVYVVRREG